MVGHFCYLQKKVEDKKVKKIKAKAKEHQHPKTYYPCYVKAEAISFPYDHIKEACQKDQKEYQSKITKHYKDCLNMGMAHGVCQNQWLQSSYNKSKVRTPSSSVEVRFKALKLGRYGNSKNCEKLGIKKNEVLTAPIKFFNIYDRAYGRPHIDVFCEDVRIVVRV